MSGTAAKSAVLCGLDGKSQDPTMTDSAPEKGVVRVSWTRWLLVLPFIAILWVPFYNSVEPRLWSVPFFFWYQLLWVLLVAVIIGIVYRAEHKSS
jgi:hypothetical protein